jgi:hypothetical protein
MPEHYMLNEWWENLRKALAEFGRDLQAMLKMEQLLRDAGFVNIEERVVKIPIGPWAKDKKLKTAGMYCRAMVEDGLEGLSLGPMSRGTLCLILSFEVLSGSYLAFIPLLHIQSRSHADIHMKDSAGLRKKFKFIWSV